MYDTHPFIKVYRNKGRVVTDGISNTDSEVVAVNNRNFYCFAIFKCAPIIMQRFLYDGGHYLSGKVFNQEIASLHTAFGTPKGFNSHFEKLDYLKALTEVKEQGNYFVTMTNDLPHLPALLQLPDYLPKQNVDNSEYESNDIVRKDDTGNVLKIKTKLQVSHYHANMATMLKLSEWLDFMRENGVYDNTKIILVGDHGWNLRHFDNLVVEDIKDGYGDIERYYPLLLVKDFNAKGFNVSDEFMTNADVPTIAFNGIVDKPVNPFTGKEINSNDKLNKQYVLGSDRYRLHMNEGRTTFTPIKWYSVHTNMLDKNNWKPEKGEAVLPY